MGAALGMHNCDLDAVELSGNLNFKTLLRAQ